MPLIGVSDFVKRQTPASKYNHFEGSWNELVALTESWWAHQKTSPHHSGVLLIPVPPGQLHRFYTSIVPVTPESTLRAEFSPRVAGEAAFIQVEIVEGQKIPAQQAEIILYSHETLEQDGDAPPTREADYYIISVNAYASVAKEPISPMTMARNFLGLKGGTRPETPYTAEEFANAIVYWSQHARLGRPSHSGNG